MFEARGNSEFHHQRSAPQPVHLVPVAASMCAILSAMVSCLAAVDLDAGLAAYS